MEASIAVNNREPVIEIVVYYCRFFRRHARAGQDTTLTAHFNAVIRPGTSTVSQVRLRQIASKPVIEF
jgi:hypothetical protein